MTIHLDGPGVTISDVVAVARRAEPVELTPAAIERMAAARAIVEQLAEGAPKYGISTGFGALATVSIPPDRRRALQVALVRSHAAGMGDPVEDEVVRAMVLLRARTLALGNSGARPLVAQAMVDILNAGITPIVPEYGSLGASGDLAPLAHGALALLGEGDVVHDGRVRPAADALRDAGLEPIELAEKEGLAVTNGTDAILGMLCLAIADTERLLVQADMITAMTVEGLLATDTPFAADLQALRPQPGQAVSAANLRAMLAGSPIVASHANDDDLRVQDAYSIRCTPSVHGAVRDTLDHCRSVAQYELASAIDNPMVLADGRVESCGNFHGAPLGFAADFLAIAVVRDRCHRRTPHGPHARQDPQPRPPAVPRRRGRRRQRTHDRPLHRRRHGLGEQATRRTRHRSTHSPPRACRKTTSPWRGSPPANSARSSTTSVASSPSSTSAPHAPSTCAHHSSHHRPPARSWRCSAREVDGVGPDRYLAPELAAAEALLDSSAMVDALDAVGVTLA